MTDDGGVKAMDERILVVDDESLMRRVLRQALEIEGYAVAEASGGEDAIEMIREMSYDLVIMDIKMPGLNGFQTLEEVRKFSEVPVIMLSGLGESANISTALLTGADDFVKKPFHMGELVARIQAKLRRK